MGEHIPRPLIAKSAMNGAQPHSSHADPQIDRATCPNIFGKSVSAIPVVGNLLSVGATYNGIYGKEGMQAYYNDCMAGKN